MTSRMATEREYQAALIHLEQELDGFVGAAFVDLETGRKLAAHTVRPAFNQSAVANAARVALTAQMALVQSLGAHAGVEDILVTMSDRLHLYCAVTPAVVLIVSAERAETNFALVRAAARCCAKHIASSDERTVGGLVLNGTRVS